LRKPSIILRRSPRHLDTHLNPSEGIYSPFILNFWAVMTLGAVSGAVNAVVNGMDMRKGMLMGAVSSAAFFGVGKFFSGLAGQACRIGTYNFGGNWLTAGEIAAQITTHATVGGILAVAQDGKFGHGFVSAGITKSLTNMQLAADQVGEGLGALVSGMTGGTVSALTGGKFANGFQTSVFQYLFNAEATRAAEGAQKERSFWDNPGRHLPSVPQGTMDFAGGLGDAILWGFGDDIRASLGIDGGINTGSDLYGAGKITSIFAGGVGVYRGLYVGSFKLASMSNNMRVLNGASGIRNFMKRWTGPALFSAAERAKIVPFSTHVANKGFDAARAGLGRTRDAYNWLIGLSPGVGGVANE
jgi:hypothetical protein